MTITNAISSALSGLAARGREAGVVSSNISNATTEGYARRVADVSSSPHGTVRVEGIRRMEDTVLSADLRVAHASQAGADATAEGLKRLERAFGSPDEAGSLSAKLARVEGALTDAASDPGSEARLRAVSNALVEFTDGVQAASDAIRDARTMAEADIEKDVSGLERGLSRVAELNAQIAKAEALGRDVTALEDQRRAEIDTLAQSVPVKAYERKDGMVSLVAKGGVQLLEGTTPARIEFSAAGLVTADMRQGAGLEGVRIRGEATDPAAPGGRLSGGTLGAHMALRDGTLPELQARLDTVAADVARRLDTVSPGLLTANGGPVAATDPGVAGELMVEPTVVAEPWRLRAGVAATGPGAVGDSTLLRGFADALARPEGKPTVFVPGAAVGTEPGAFTPGHGNVSELLADVTSGLASARLSAETSGAVHAASAEVLRQEEREDGVDTDVELQKLMDIERGYAASARVLSTVDDMLARILEI